MPIYDPHPAMLREFDRLYKEAEEVCRDRDDFLKLVFNAAARLSSGAWKVPQITNCYVEPKQQSDSERSLSP